MDSDGRTKHLQKHTKAHCCPGPPFYDRSKRTKTSCSLSSFPLFSLSSFHFSLFLFLPPSSLLPSLRAASLFPSRLPSVSRPWSRTASWWTAPLCSLGLASPFLVLAHAPISSLRSLFLFLYVFKAGPGNLIQISVYCLFLHLFLALDFLSRFI